VAKLLSAAFSQFSFFGGPGVDASEVEAPDGEDEGGPYRFARFSCGLINQGGKKLVTIDFDPGNPKAKPLVLDLENAGKVAAVIVKVLHDAECEDCRSKTNADSESVH